MRPHKWVFVFLFILLIAFTVFVVPTPWRYEKPGTAGALLDGMHISEGDWVADVGSAEGEYALQMARGVGESGRVFAVDIDEDALEELNETVTERDVENMTVVSSVADNPMLPRASFDAVLVRNTYHEFTAHEAMLEHLCVALKPSGRLVLAEFIGQDLKGEDRAKQVANHELAPRYARQELEQAGFEIVKEVTSVEASRFLLAMQYLRREVKRIGIETFGAPGALKEGMAAYRMWVLVAECPGGSRGTGG